MIAIEKINLAIMANAQQLGTYVFRLTEEEIVSTGAEYLYELEGDELADELATIAFNYEAIDREGRNVE